MRILQINSVYGSGSTGRISKDIHDQLIKLGHECLTYYGRGNSKLVDSKKISNRFELFFHGLMTRFFDRHGLHSSFSTKKMIRLIKKFNPDIIHLHNIHGYYLNYRILFEYLKDFNGRIIWTLHDSWAYTGHCSFYLMKNCIKWQTKCNNCPARKSYPKSFFLDRSFKNFIDKRNSFNKVKNLTLITPSIWLKNQLDNSFLANNKTHVINNGIDMEKFKPLLREKTGETRIILGVANIWDERKGLTYFMQLSKIISKKYLIILIGLNKKQIKILPVNIIGIEKTNSIDELVQYYSQADVFVNPTLEDNFPTTNLEAMSCGLPIVTFNTGGCSEVIESFNGIVTKHKSAESILEAIEKIINNPTLYDKTIIRNYALSKYTINEMLSNYMNLYLS